MICCAFYVCAISFLGLSAASEILDLPIMLPLPVWFYRPLSDQKPCVSSLNYIFIVWNLFKNRMFYKTRSDPFHFLRGGHGGRPPPAPDLPPPAHYSPSSPFSRPHLPLPHLHLSLLLTVLCPPTLLSVILKKG